jgi:NAD(P)H dehydrogenase (quinone)
VGKILVTGASGFIGKRTLLHLLERVPANQLVGLVRDPAKAEDLAPKGIELRQGDYLDPESLDRAFTGVEKLMLTSTHAFTDRIAAHGNVIDAAVKAGIQHVVYMPIYRKPGSTLAMKEITDEDKFTVEKLLSSGLTYALARHPPFLESTAMYATLNAAENGVQVPAGSGKFAAATRDDLAAAHAAILTETGHENKTYYLSGSPAVSFADIAAILSEIHGVDVPYITVSGEAYVKIVNTAGLPEFIAQFVLKWVQGMNLGEWEEETRDLETLIGRKPKTPAEYLRELADAARIQEKA